MAESSSEKTEQPTSHKLRKARQQGQVPQSRELTGAVVLVAIILGLAYRVDRIGTDMQAITYKSIQTALGQELTARTVLLTTFESVRTVAGTFMPLLVIIVTVGIFMPFVQIGAMITGEPLKPKLDKLNPIKGFKQLFFSLETYANLIKAVAKITVLGILCGAIIYDSLGQVVLLSGHQPLGIAYTAGGIIVALLKRAALFLLLLGVLDLFYQRWKYMRDQRMTKEEVKREFKDQEGDPQHKADRQRLHEEIATNTMLQQVRTADVVVTNPTHIACALRFNPDDEDAPRLVGKGRGYLAEKIKQIAKEQGIPVMRDVSLARALYDMELDTQIPEALYDAVAVALRWVETEARSRGQLPPGARPRTIRRPLHKTPVIRCLTHCVCFTRGGNAASLC